MWESSLSPRHMLPIFKRMLFINETPSAAHSLCFSLEGDDTCHEALAPRFFRESFLLARKRAAFGFSPSPQVLHRAGPQQTHGTREWRKVWGGSESSRRSPGATTELPATQGLEKPGQLGTKGNTGLYELHLLMRETHLPRKHFPGIQCWERPWIEGMVGRQKAPSIPYTVLTGEQSSRQENETTMA